MNKNLRKGILIMVLCTFFTTVGQLFFKYGSVNFKFNILGLLTNYNLLLGFLFYGLGAVLLIVALKFGNLSTIYPLVALTFVWVMITSFFVLGEVINNFKIGAVTFIIFGVVLVVKGEKE